MEFCQSLNQDISSLESKRINKRSPIARKKGGRRGGSGRVSSKVRSAFSGSVGKKGQKALSAILLNRNKNKFGTPSRTVAKGVKRKSGVLRKVGKYAVVGLAAYGTYKLAKKMSKGLRRSYDDDDCWEYSYLYDRYSCNCDNQCDVYVGAAHAISATFGLLSLSIIGITVPNFCNAVSFNIP